MNPAQKSPEGGRSARHPPPHPTHQSRRPAAAAFGIREAARAPRSPRSPRSPRTKAELARAAQKSPEGGRRPGGEQVDPPTTRRPPESTGVSHSGPLGIGSHLITKVIYKKKRIGAGKPGRGVARRWRGAPQFPAACVCARTRGRMAPDPRPYVAMCTSSRHHRVPVPLRRPHEPVYTMPFP